MKAEIIAVGTEILLGQITNTNAQYLSQELANIGIYVYFQTVVGDNKERLEQAFELAQNRADLVICTGGIGPTQDDLTKDVLAAYTGNKLTMHQPTLDQIQAYFDQRGISMIESNARQALIMEQCFPLLNDVGMAVGLVLQHNHTSYVVLPGPPREMKAMFENHAKPWLLSQLKDEIPLYSKTLKFGGIGESTVEHKLIDLIKHQEDPTIAPYAKEGEVAIRLTTRAKNAEQGEEKIRETELKIRASLGAHIFAETDISLEAAVVSLLSKEKLSVSVAESCTGGMLSNLITEIPGSASVFRGGIICYSNQMKNTLLHVPMELLEGKDAEGAVSASTAKVLAESMMEQSGTDFSISITGVAGPSQMEGKPVGLIYIGFAQKGQETQVEEVQYTGNREIIKLKACKFALYKLWLSVRERQKESSFKK